MNPDAPRPLAPAPLKVLYVAGCGRSGSTLLSVMLNAHSLIVSVGELKFLAEWLARSAPCTCGMSVMECPFWSRVLSAALPDGTSPATPELEVLLPGIAEIARSEVIVDTSKTAAELEQMMKVPGIELYIIHLVRDGRGYLRSRTRSVRKQTVRPGIREPSSTSRAIIRWLSTNLGIARFRCRVPHNRFIRVRYEDLVAAPEAELERICAFVGVDFEPSMLDASIEGCHDIGGNGWRYQQSRRIQLKLDRSWEQALTRGQRWLFGFAAGWLNRLYGY